jgi:hypothetical protein
MSFVVLRADDVERLLPMDECIEASPLPSSSSSAAR